MCYANLCLAKNFLKDWIYLISYDRYLISTYMNTYLKGTI